MTYIDALSIGIEGREEIEEHCSTQLQDRDF